jgi:hypothetical protein
MSKKEEFRLRAQRFLTGTFDQSDLNALFLFFRTNSFGCMSVRDLGDMIGHAETRNKGISVDAVRAMRTVAAFHLKRIGNNEADFNLNRVPSDFFDLMDAALIITSAADLKDMTGLNKKQAKSNLFAMRHGFSHLLDGSRSVKGYSLAKNDLNVVNALSRSIISGGPYNADVLFQETLHLFKKHDFLELDQEKNAHARKDHLTLFAIAAMHGVIFDLSDGMNAEAMAGWHTRDGLPILHVAAHFIVPFGNDYTKIAFELFSTDLRADHWCENYDATQETAIFLDPIEVTGMPKLRCLTSKDMASSN